MLQLCGRLCPAFSLPAPNKACPSPSVCRSPATCSAGCLHTACSCLCCNAIYTQSTLWLHTAPPCSLLPALHMTCPLSQDPRLSDPYLDAQPPPPAPRYSAPALPSREELEEEARQVEVGSADAGGCRPPHCCVCRKQRTGQQLWSTVALWRRQPTALMQQALSALLHLPYSLCCRGMPSPCQTMLRRRLPRVVPAHRARPALRVAQAVTVVQPARRCGDDTMGRPVGLAYKCACVVHPFARVRYS